MNATLTISGNKLDPSECTLSFATRSYPGAEPHPIKYYDDGDGYLWIMRDTSGILGIVRARTESDAYSCVGDELRTPIAPEDVHEAYGAFDQMVTAFEQRGHENDYHLRDFCNRYARLFFELWTDRSTERGGIGWPSGDDIDLIEGYEFQDHATGTGIVSIDLNGESLEPLTERLINDLQIEVTVTFAE